MRKTLLVILVTFTIFITATLATSDSQQFVTLTYYDGQWMEAYFGYTGEHIIYDIPTIEGCVSPGPYPYEFNPTEPVHAYLQIRHFLWGPTPDDTNQLAIYLDGVAVLEAESSPGSWYPGGDGIDFIDLETVPAGTHNITMSATAAGCYVMDWWKILVPVEVVKTIHEVSAADRTFYVATVTGNDSTISNFMFDETFVHENWVGLISFDVTGPSGTTGFCNITIPTDLMRGDPWLILINDTITPETIIIDGNGTHTFLYFTYPHNAHIEISGTWVVPEFPTTLLLPLLIIVTLAAVILRKKLWSTKHRDAMPH